MEAYASKEGGMSNSSKNRLAELVCRLLADNDRLERENNKLKLLLQIEREKQERVTLIPMEKES